MMNCSTCNAALFLHDRFGNKCISAVYCPLNRCLVDIDDVCCEYEEFSLEFEVE